MIVVKGLGRLISRGLGRFRLIGASVRVELSSKITQLLELSSKILQRTEMASKILQRVELPSKTSAWRVELSSKITQRVELSSRAGEG